MTRSLLSTLGDLGDAPIRHAYVHVPFCASICPFCSFHVAVRERGAVRRYLADLDAELAEIAAHCRVELDTLYLGGGTPSYLRGDELEELLASVTQHLGTVHVEITLEVHPSTATRERIERWVALGVNRLSVGAQSFDDQILAALGRTHSAQDNRTVIDWCRSTGATTSLDLMMPSPGQDIAADLDAAIATGVDHISVYALTIEPNTPFAVQGRVVDDGDAADALEAAAEVLSGAGYERYEVSNYARAGARCVHNQAYWNAAPCLGIGPSGSGLVASADGAMVRYTNPPLSHWMAPPRSIALVSSARTGDDTAGVELSDVEVLAGEELMADLIVCGLRLVEGLDLDVVTQRCGIDPRSHRLSELERLVEGGLVTIDGSTVRATDRGRLLLDSVTSALM